MGVQTAGVQMGVVWEAWKEEECLEGVTWEAETEEVGLAVVAWEVAMVECLEEETGAADLAAELAAELAAPRESVAAAEARATAEEA
mgnify:CR=1 FL=1